MTGPYDDMLNMPHPGCPAQTVPPSLPLLRL